MANANRFNINKLMSKKLLGFMILILPQMIFAFGSRSGGTAFVCSALETRNLNFCKSFRFKEYIAYDNGMIRFKLVDNTYVVYSNHWPIHIIED